MDRQAEVNIALGSAKLSLVRFTSHERLSEPFTIQVEGFSETAIDFLEHMGKPVSLEAGDSHDHVRWFHGRLTASELIHVDVNGSRYRLTLKSWFQILDQNLNYRIFQNKSVTDIAKEIFADRGVTANDYDFRLSKTYPEREYCVQYKESDFNFLSRLFEQEGIYYFFEHDKTAHKLVLCDSKSAHKAAPDYGKIRHLPVQEGRVPFTDTLTTWMEKVSSASQIEVLQRAFDFKDREKIKVAKSHVDGQHPGDALELYSYPDDFVDPPPAVDRGDVRLAAARAQRQIYCGEGDVLGLACGGLFELTESKPDRFNAEYLIVGIVHHVEAEAHRTGDARQARSTKVEAIPSKTAFRPFPVTPKPYVTGVETATVVGKESEAVVVDEWGRVRVRFNWDRREKVDPEYSDSIWMRVSHHAAGVGFGNVDLPRVGQEVIVDFLGGDPDHPIITGRVYNNREKHPYDLPTHRSRSTWKTQTMLGPTGGGYEDAEDQGDIPNPGYNELRFEDKSGSEEVYIHAQRDMLTVVRRDDEFQVKQNRKVRIGKDRTTNIQHDDTETVETGDYKLTVDQGYAHIKAQTKITLECGQSTIVLEPASIKLKSIAITSEAQTLNKMQGLTVEVLGDSSVTVKGAIIMIN